MENPSHYHFNRLYSNLHSMGGIDYHAPLVEKGFMNLNDLIDEAYEAGKLDQKEDYKSDLEEEKRESYDEGYEEAYEAGKDEGFYLGYDEGLIEAKEKYYDEGYEQGIQDGHADSFDEGWKDGYDQANVDRDATEAKKVSLSSPETSSAHVVNQGME